MWRVVYVLNPDHGNEIQANLARAIGEALWRWLLLLSSQVGREREGLLAVWNHLRARSEGLEGPEGHEGIDPFAHKQKRMTTSSQSASLPLFRHPPLSHGLMMVRAGQPSCRTTDYRKRRWLAGPARPDSNS